MVSLLFSLGNVLADLGIAIFAVSTWYSQYQERRARMFLRTCLESEQRLILAAEVMVELRDFEGLKNILVKYTTTEDLKNINNKIRHLNYNDALLKLSLILFGFGIAIEIVAFFIS